MADVIKAVTFVLRLEDSRLTGEITDIPGDAGGKTRFGLAERWHPELARKGFYSATMGNQEAFALAVATYKAEYAVKLGIAAIADQRVADSLLSSGINIGCVEAAKILQKACGCDEDGVVGPATLAAANAMPGLTLLTALVEGQEHYYQMLAALKPTDQQFLKGWINRAKAPLALQEA